MKQFPTAWMRIDVPVVSMPVDVVCLACGDPFQEHQLGLLLPHSGAEGESEEPWHRDCFLKALGVRDMCL